MYEELEPIDKNLQYDFNYQQINHLTREVTVLPVSVGSGLIEDTHHIKLLFFQGDLIQLKCFYDTEGVDGVTIVSVIKDHVFNVWVHAHMSIMTLYTVHCPWL